MAASPAPPDTARDIELEEVSVAQTELEPPYRILIHNDDVTPFDFVIAVLRTVFLLGARDAWVVTTRAHVTGVAYVMTLPFEEAKYRVGKAHSLARAAGFPLSFAIEPDA